MDEGKAVTNECYRIAVWCARYDLGVEILGWPDPYDHSEPSRAPDVESAYWSEIALLGGKVG